MKLIGRKKIICFISDKWVLSVWFSLFYLVIRDNIRDGFYCGYVLRMFFDIGLLREVIICYVIIFV